MEVIEFLWVIFPVVVQSVLEIINSFGLHNVFWKIVPNWCNTVIERVRLGTPDTIV